MANAFFKQGRTAIAQGDVVWKAVTTNIKAQLIDLGSLTQAKVITAATTATPIAVTTAAHGLATGDKVTIKGGTGMTVINGTWTITVTSTTAFTLDGSVGSGTYTASSATAVPLTLAGLSFLANIAAGARTGNPSTLTLVDAVDGVLDAVDTVFSAVTGSQSEAIIIYKDTGSTATSPLLLYLDSAASGLPVTPNGGDITVTWDNGANKIARL